MNRFDRFLLFLLIVILIGFFILFEVFGKTGSTAYIEYNGKIIKEIDLLKQQDIIFKVKGDLGEVLIEVKDKKIRVLDSNCHDKLCIKQSFIEKENETIICLPNKISIRIEGKEQNLDGVSY